MILLIGTILVAMLPPTPAEPPHDKGQSSSHPAAGLAASDSWVALLKHPEVQKELNLGKEQIQKMDQIIRAIHEKQQHELDGLQLLSPPDRRRKQGELAKTAGQEIQRRLTELLEPSQRRRLEQLRRQQQGLRAFADPEVEKALHLTVEQKTRLKMISADAAKEAQLLFRSGAQNGFEATIKKIETLGREAVDKAVALLTPEQKKSWQELIGKPFVMHSQPPLIRRPE